MSERTAHILLEKQGNEFDVSTNTEHPGIVFIHINAGGFRFCQGITAKEARMMGMAFFDAMDATEADKAQAVEA
ncbi:hypothetical protein RAE21_06300 [Rhodoferax sp. TBRC 17198]|uniref:hypothetical protein n=1 Tax=Rhodoferax potami TaxID=3068338 RepID=UPI0028BD72DC|nr:hypothetical protein [Rhodoferax sp. TBRC 17198]MDT7522022.1 hypothetical protein [Rhodoferax sp. TBRC 17198]